MKLIAALFAATAIVAPAHAQERDDLEKLVGRWAHEGTGTVMRIEPAFIGWELWHARFGQFALVQDSTAGAHIKMSGQPRADGTVNECFYYVSMVQNGERMILNRRKGSVADCLEGAYAYVAQPGKTRAQEIADAIAYRRRLTSAVASGPSDMQGVEVIYFEREADNGKVRQALERGGIGFDPRASESPERSNVITCQRDVPIEATKYLARTLIEAGIPIRAIRPTQFQQFSKRLTVEYLGAWMPTRPLVTLAQVDALTTCNLNNLDGKDLAEPVSARPSPQAQVRPRVTVSFPNAPAPAPRYVPLSTPVPVPVPVQPTVSAPPIPESVPGPKVPITVEIRYCPVSYNVTAKFWSPAINGWQMTHLKGIGEGTWNFKNGDDTNVTTSTREVYFFSRNLNTMQPVALKGDAVWFPGGEVGYYKRSPNLTITCPR